MGISATDRSVSVSACIQNECTLFKYTATCKLRIEAIVRTARQQRRIRDDELMTDNVDKCYWLRRVRKFARGSDTAEAMTRDNTVTR